MISRNTIRRRDAGQHDDQAATPTRCTPRPSPLRGLVAGILALATGLGTIGVLAPGAHAQTFGPRTELLGNAAAIHDATPRIATDGSGTWITVWTIRGGFAPEVSDGDVVFARSTDGGASWKPTDLIHWDLASDQYTDEGPQIATDGRGTWVVVWETERSTPSGSATSREILFSRSTDGGLEWSPPALLSASIGGDCFSPQVASDGAGGWVVVWMASNYVSFPNPDRTYAKAVFTRSSDDGASWSVPLGVDPSWGFDPSDNLSPVIASDAPGSWLAMWERRGASAGDSTLRFARSVDGGKSWFATSAVLATAPRPVSLAADASGTFIAAWTAPSPDMDIHYIRSIDRGTTWSAPALLDANAARDLGDDGAPRITSNGAGAWMAVWPSFGALGQDIDVLTARSTNGGASWSPAVPLHADAATDGPAPDCLDDTPDVATDGAGRWVAVWEFACGPQADYDIVAARNLDADDVAIDFGSPFGIWARENDAAWTQIDAISPEGMVAADLDLVASDDLVVDFGAQHGVWARMNGAAWKKLHGASPESMVRVTHAETAQSVVADFGPQGIRGFTEGAWAALDTVDPEAMVSADLDGDGSDELAVDAGAAGIKMCRYETFCFNGICGFDYSCTPLHPISPAAMVAGDTDGNGRSELIVDFGAPYGIWVWKNGATWVKLHSISSRSMATGDTDGNGRAEVIIDFGPAYGIWVRENDSAWSKLHGVSSESIATADMDGNGQAEVIIDFGPAYGLWVRKNAAAWTKLHGASPEDMAVGDLDP